MTPRERSKVVPIDSIDRQLPQDPDCERAVLGAVLINPDALPRVLGILDESDFFRDGHRLIFAALRRLADSSRAIDLLTAKSALADAGELDRAGGSAYVSSLTDRIPDIANVERYARIVREMSARRRLIVVGNQIMRDAFAGENEAGEIASSNALRLSEFAVTEDKGPQPIGAVVRRMMADFDERVERGEAITGIRSGLPNLDAYTLGFQRGAESIIAARTRVGKTAFANAIALSAAQRGERVLYVELDMPENMLGARLLASLAGLPVVSVRSGVGMDDERLSQLVDATAAMSKLPITLDCSTRDIAKLSAVVRRQARSGGGLDLILVDHIGHVRGGRGEQRYLEIADVSSRLIELAGETNAAVISLVQLQRVAEKEEPQLHHLRESGDLEQDARLVALLDRPALRDEVNEKTGEKIAECEMQIRVAKNEGEAGAVFVAHFDRHRQRVTQEAERRCGEGCSYRPPASGDLWSDRY